MMMNEMVKNNKVINIIKNVILSFFALVFVMGFFSKSTINLMLPKVHTVSAIDNTSIEKTVKIDGVIKPINTYKVRVDRNVIVQEYFVKAGDKVDVGAPIFRIDKNYGGKGNSELIEELNLQLQEKQLQLEKLEDTTSDIEEKNIKVLKNKIEKAQEEVKNQEILFKAGAISKSQLEESELQLEEQIISFETNLTNLENQKKDNQYSADKIKNEIEKLKSDIDDLKAQKEFYAHLGQDGICYAEKEGIILATSETDVILNKDTVIAEIGVVDGLKSVKFVAQIDKSDLDILEDVGFIEVTNEDNSKSRISITKISKLANGSKLQLEGQFVDEVKRNIIIDEKIQGIAAKKYDSEGFHSLPKTAIILKEGLEEGKLGSVFMIEEKDGVLGKEIIAKEVEVKINAVGDDKVIVEGLGNYNKPQLINNLSYKIKDGVRVHLCE